MRRSGEWRNILVGSVLVLLTASSNADQTVPEPDQSAPANPSGLERFVALESEAAGAAPGVHCTDTHPPLCATEPANPDFNGLPETLEGIQKGFDVFSWELFVALNWPAASPGEPDTSVTIGDKPGQPTVWQTYMESRDIFLPNGQVPPDWGGSSPLPAVCGGDTPPPPGISVLSQVGKTPNTLDESGQPFETGPLIDQNGHYARFAILTNEKMFDYIVKHKLYSKAGQAEFDRDADFPFSTDTEVAAIMVKSAWKIIGEGDDPERFHTTEAYVYNNPNEHAGVEASCSLQRVGLVGLHFATKIQRHPQWIWSTFEHVDNVPTQGETPEKAHYNFYKPNCTDCTAVNTPPPRPWNPAIPHTQPSQIERVIPIDAPTKALNAQYQAALNQAKSDSVWANYQLVSTQWPVDANNSTDPTGNPAPPFLANTTLESYIQGRVKQVSSSCIQCHNNATMTDGRFADFTYLLQRAQ